jgi:hypothetical protein
MRHAEAAEGQARQNENRRDARARQAPADQGATPPVGVAYPAADQAVPPAAHAQPSSPDLSAGDRPVVPAAVAVPPPVQDGDSGDSGEVLFGAADVQRFRARWRELQADFVDDPQQAVQGADDLVGEVMRALTEIVADHKRRLEGEWRDGAGETEELRVALRRYRAFLDQLLTTRVQDRI